MIKEIFPIRIYESKIDDSSYEQIKPPLYNYIENNTHLFKIVKTWLGNTATDFPKTNFYSESLKNEVYKHSYRYLEGLDPNIFELEIVSLWINVNGKGTFQEDHHHIGRNAQISGTIYIETCDLGGDFEIINPNILENYIESNKNYLDRFKITVKPYNKKIIMFPSYLMHRVTPNQTDKQRVSISFNLGIKDPTKYELYSGGSPKNYGYYKKN